MSVARDFSLTGVFAVRRIRANQCFPYKGGCRDVGKIRFENLVPTGAMDQYSVLETGVGKQNGKVSLWDSRVHPMPPWSL
jgi:hypothetical protein